MGLETLLEAAKYLEYKAEVEARGEKGFSDLPTGGSNSSTVIVQPPSQNGFTNHGGNLPNVLHFTTQTHVKNQPNAGYAILPKVPETGNGFKVSDHSYRRISSVSQSPTDFNGTNNNNRTTKNNNNSLNNRNSGTREVHNKLEKNRRAHLKECFELLKSQLPAFEDRKISNLAILRSSLRHIQNLKRKEREFEHEMERLAREKISLQQRLSQLKKDMLSKLEHLDWQAVVPEDFDMDVEGSNSVCGDGNGHMDSHSLDTIRSQKSESRSPTSDIYKPLKRDIELEDSGDSQHPVSLTVSNCHIGKKLTVNKVFGQINGMNGVSGSGPVSLVTTGKSPLR